MGMVYQQSNWIRALNVQENVAFTATLEGVDTRTALRQAHDMLAQVGMTEWELYYPTELSSGQQQKVNLARALITDPNVLIADEPTGNLDHLSSVELLELFVGLHRKGKTIIMVTHDIENIGYATHVVQMYDGHILKVFDMHKASHESVVQELVTNKSSTALPLGVKLQAKKPQYVPKQSRADSLLTHIRRNIHVSDPRSLLRETFSSLIKSLRFAVLLVMYAVYKALHMFVSAPLLPRSLSRTLSDGLYQVFSFIGGFDRSEVRSIRSIDLIDISIKGLFAKKVRTFVTVSGMALGIGAIVFLVSIGYGLEKLVITRVARLEEMKQIDIAPAVASNISINDMTIATFESISNVAQVLPVIGVVGTVNYQKSSTDVAVQSF
jgi:ABC-type proline/glycine betaine transport system ATPase subunit